MTMSELAKKEIELFKKKQDMYGQMCADSAFRAFMSMANDSHSGFSWDVTSGILIRLLYALPLTSITDEAFLDQDGLFQESPDSLRKRGLKSSLECNRLCSVFRNETLDGRVSYTDIDRVMCYDEENPGVSFTCGIGTKIVDKMFPITMPYYPTVTKYIVMFKDEKPIWVKTPDGEKIPVDKE